MKKLFACAVALVLCCTGVCAHAWDTGAGFRFSLDSFKIMYEAINASLEAGLSLDWSDEPDTSNGYDMYVGQAGDGEIYVSAHDIDGLKAFEIDLFLTRDELNNDADSFGDKLGKAILVLGYTVYFMDNGDLDQDTVNHSITEITDLVSTPAGIEGGSEESGDKIEKIGTFCGYPAGVSLSMTEDGRYRAAFILLSMTGSF